MLKGHLGLVEPIAKVILAIACAAMLCTPSVVYAQDSNPEGKSPDSLVESSPNGKADKTGANNGQNASLTDDDVNTDDTPADPSAQTADTDKADAKTLKITASPDADDQVNSPSALSLTTTNDNSNATTKSNQESVSYDYNAKPYSPETGSAGTTADADGVYPGVYTTKLEENAGTENPQTIGIPSIADANLPDAPTTESPAIIQGAAVGYEEKTGATEFTKIKDRDAPYEYFKYSILEEKGQDGTTHKKMSGFDGTYVILRLDVTALFAGADPETSYLHVKQDDNRALLVAIGMTDNTFVGTLTTVPEGETDYKAGSVYKTGSYKLADMYDATGSDKNTPYLDVIVFATAANVAGADAGKEGALTGDIPLSFYIDNTEKYNETTYDPQSTDANHIINCLEKFYDATKAATSATSHYVVKGSDLALETMVENSGGKDGTETTYWSLEKSLEKPYYDQEIDKSPDDPGCGRTVKLMSEVAVIDELTLAGKDANNLKKRTLDVNSFDVQVAKNSESNSTGFTLKNAWLTIADKSATTGAELAIGNNAHFSINSGGKLIIDETAQLEIEWDGATTTTGQSSDTLNNGVLDLNEGGELVNNGVITIEGTEGKPYQPGQQTDTAKGFGEFTIKQGAKLTNNGAMLVYGRLYNLGTLVNNGKYDDTIDSTDPDQGKFSYHRGIQVSWKDDVTQANVTMGELLNGISKTGAKVVEAALNNFGDILLAPGKLVNYGILNNEEGAHIYLAAAEEAIIPIEPTAEAPTVVSKRISINPPVGSSIENYGTINNKGTIIPASVEILDNTGFGKLSVPGNHTELFKLVNNGTVVNDGYIWGWEKDDPKNGNVNPDTPKSHQANKSSASSIPATSDLLPSWALLALLAIASVSAGSAMVARRKG